MSRFYGSVCIVSYAVVVFNVLLTSAKTHSSDTDSAKNTEHVAVSREHSQNQLACGIRELKGHPFPVTITVYAHVEQKRAWLHGTKLRSHVEPAARLRTFRSHVTLRTLTLT